MKFSGLLASVAAFAMAATVASSSAIGSTPAPRAGNVGHLNFMLGTTASASGVSKPQNFMHAIIPSGYITASLQHKAALSQANTPTKDSVVSTYAYVTAKTGATGKFALQAIVDAGGTIAAPEFTTSKLSKGPEKRS